MKGEGRSDVWKTIEGEMTKLGESEGGSESEIGIGNGSGNGRDDNVTVFNSVWYSSEHNIHAVYLIMRNALPDG